MPLYCYRCPNGHEEERLEPLDAPESHPCPECKGTAERTTAQTGPWKFGKGQRNG